MLTDLADLVSLHAEERSSALYWSGVGQAMDQTDYQTNEKRAQRVLRQVHRQRAILRHPYQVTLSHIEVRWLCQRLLTPMRLEATTDTGRWLRLLKQQLDQAIATTPATALTDPSASVSLIIPQYCVEQLAALEYAYIPGPPAGLLADYSNILPTLETTASESVSPQAFTNDADVAMARHLARAMFKRVQHMHVAPFETPLAVDDLSEIVADRTDDNEAALDALAADDALMDEIDAARTMLAKMGSAPICDGWPDPEVTRIITAHVAQA